MGAVLLTNEFPAAGISVFAELWYREPMLVPYMNMTQTLYFLDLMQNERQ